MIFGIQNTNLHEWMRLQWIQLQERLLREPNLTLNLTIEQWRAAEEAKQNQTNNFKK